MTRRPLTDEDIFDYLVELRDSGETNMWGASAYITAEFGIPEKEAGEVLIRWMKHLAKEEAK